jgi:hypothetical protein
MATITSAQSGDFSDTATWVGGVVPTVGDTAVAATGHVVVIDTDVTVDGVDQAGSGKFTLGNGRTLTANVRGNVDATIANGGCVEFVATAGNSATIVGDIFSDTGTSNLALAVVVMSGAGTLNVTGDITTAGENAGSITTGPTGIFSNAVSSDGLNITGNLTSSNRRHSCVRLDSAATTPVTITGNIISSGGNDTAVALFVASSATVAVTGNVVGGTSNSSHAISCTGASTNVSVTGDVTGGSATTANGISATGATTTITVTGDVTGGSGTTAYGISATGTSATINATGDITGGSGTSAHGIYATGASSIINVSGIISGVGNSSAGIRSDATTGYVVFGGNLIDSPAGTPALHAIRARIKSTQVSGYNQYSTTDGFVTGSPVQRVSADTVTGMPAATDVRLATEYGFNDELTGTMIVPPSSSVLTGVLVDDGTGSLVLDSKEAIADAVLHLLAGITESGSVVTIPFYGGSKDYTRTAIIDGTRTRAFTEIGE